MNKSRRAQRGGLPTEKKEKTEEKKKEKEEVETEKERSPERKTPIKPHVPATYSIFTTLKFPPKGKRPALHQKPPSGKQGAKQDTSFQYKESKKPIPDTSFYYKDNSSSNYDLTLARKEQEVVAEVHEASPKVTTTSSRATIADLLLFSRRGTLEKEVQVLCHCCHQGWNELKDSTPSEPFRRGAPHNFTVFLLGYMCGK